MLIAFCANVIKWPLVSCVLRFSLENGVTGSSKIKILNWWNNNLVEQFIIFVKSNELSTHVHTQTTVEFYCHVIHFWKKFRESNFLTKELIWRNIFLVRVIFSTFQFPHCKFFREIILVLFHNYVLSLPFRKVFAIMARSSYGEQKSNSDFGGRNERKQTFFEKKD